MKIIIINKTNTPKDGKKSFIAHLHGSRTEAFAKTELEALKKLVIKLEEKSDKWILTGNQAN